MPLALLAAGDAAPSSGPSSQKRKRRRRKPKEAAVEVFGDEQAESTAQPSTPQATDQDTTAAEKQRTESPDAQGTAPLTPEEEKEIEEAIKKAESNLMTEEELAAYGADLINQHETMLWQNRLRKAISEHKVMYEGRRVCANSLSATIAFHSIQGLHQVGRTRFKSRCCLVGLQQGTALHLRPLCHIVFTQLPHLEHQPSSALLS